MNNNFIFIDSKFVKKFTAIDKNVDDAIIAPYIAKAHDIYIKEALGESFYNHLVEQFQSSSATTEETRLRKDFIEKSAAEWAFYLAYPHIGYKPTNKGISKQNSEWSNNADISEFKMMHSAILRVAELYDKRLRKAVLDGYCNGDFPLAKEVCGDNPIIQKNANFSGVFTTKKRKI